MSGKDDKVRIPLEIEKGLSDLIDVDQKQRSFPDRSSYIREAIKHFQVCKEKEASQAMKPIVTKYPGKCLKCGHNIEPNSWALYGKGVGLVCMDCYVEKLGDKSLIAKYIKNRELDRVAKALKEECDKLAGRVEELRVLNKLEDLKNQQEQAIKTIMDFLTHRIGSTEENKILEELARQLKDGERIIRDMDDFVQNFIRNRKWRKQIAQQTQEQEEST